MSGCCIVERYKSERCTTDNNQSLGSTTELVRNFGRVRSFGLVRHKSRLARSRIVLAPNKLLSELRKCQPLEPPTVKRNLLPMALTESSVLVRRFETQNPLPMVPTESSELAQKLLVRRHEPQSQMPELSLIHI